jgi:hypothetical protein
MPLDDDILAKIRHIGGFNDGQGRPVWDVQSFYQRLVDEAPAGARICEVGCYHARSLAYLALAAKKSGKGIKVLAADWFRGQAGFPLDGHAMADGVMGELYKLGVLDDVTLIANKSHLAAEWVADNSLWAVFIDDDHGEEAVRASISGWLPKVVSGGILAGHDYAWPGPQKVCPELCPGHEVVEFTTYEDRVTRDVFCYRKP